MKTTRPPARPSATLSLAVLLLAGTAPAVSGQSAVRPFIGIGLTEGPKGNWSGTAGLSLLTEGAWKLSLDATTYFDGIATGRHWTTIGLEARTPPLLDDRIYFLGGPRASWTGPEFGASLGIGYLLGTEAALEAAIHQERYRRQASVGLRFGF